METQVIRLIRIILLLGNGCWSHVEKSSLTCCCCCFLSMIALYVVIRNLWNFSAKHFITDSSGMYWRERRLRPGLYTDGSTVYEATYRYRDGRNGMRSVSSFAKYLGSKAVPQKQKEKIIQRLQDDAPDVVLE